MLLNVTFAKLQSVIYVLLTAIQEKCFARKIANLRINVNYFSESGKIVLHELN